MLERKSVEVDGQPAGCLPPAGPGPASGRYVIGTADASGRLTVVFDPSAPLHAGIASRHRVTALGGGYCRLEPSLRRAVVRGSSQRFGREPDRSLTLRILASALPGWSIEAAD